MNSDSTQTLSEGNLEKADGQAKKKSTLESGISSPNGGHAYAAFINNDTILVRTNRRLNGDIRSDERRPGECWPPVMDALKDAPGIEYVHGSPEGFFFIIRRAKADWRELLVSIERIILELHLERATEPVLAYSPPTAVIQCAQHA